MAGIIRPMRTVSDEERRARLALRQRLAPSVRAATVEEATDAIVCLHATDPATVFLSAWARLAGPFEVDELKRALYERRTLVKHLAMRRTLFVFPRATLPDAQGAASDRVAVSERKKLIADVERFGVKEDGAAWLDEACAAVLELLADGRLLGTRELRAQLPVLDGSYAYGEGRSWAQRIAVGPRVLTVLSAEGRIVRATNDGDWTASRPRWASTASWLGAEIAPRDAASATAGLVARWLRAFGPGTERDITWWLGGTLRAVRAALTELGAVQVALEGGGIGWLLPDDLEPVAAPEPWAALLPSLDPTTMGWAERDWYLGPHRAELFDGAGNAGPTAWWNGRIVGGWQRGEDGAVELQLLDDPGAEGRRGLAAEGERLAAWLPERRLLMRFPSPLSKRVAAG